MYFSMIVTRDSRSSDLERSGTSDDEIHRIIVADMAPAVREAILEVFGSIKTMMIELFYECYTVVTKAASTSAITTVAITRPHGGDSM